MLNQGRKKELSTMFVYSLLFIGLIQYATAHEGHHNPAPTGQPGAPNSFHDSNMVHNEQHIKEHMQNEVNVNKPMSKEEMEFNYFRLHDTSKDNRLDGLEILAALSHMMPAPEFLPQEIQGKTPEEVAAMKAAREKEMFDNYVQIIDKVLQEDDRDQDGYLSYAEFQMARRRDEQRMQEAQAQMTPEQLQQQKAMVEQYQQQMAAQHQQYQYQQQQAYQQQQQAAQQQQQQQQPVVNMNQKH
ncbi:hypothetical protein LOTGIDRAFT_234943 [Lottia gigantea]|uniref:EF-hand domain-containing protein n=1 Tax=Lottia gigantea TaxID=225164 RepID=V3ZTJ0_LOTGI|nr:hypothetical protein LOTGIDRAFT_234943 [Lottia gigantea]ESO87697.1 hypothetical protein LOTGIDRAFT_234943 [Lottia gigantea]